jgi:hypothetical protein
VSVVIYLHFVTHLIKLTLCHNFRLLCICHVGGVLHSTARRTGATGRCRQTTCFIIVLNALIVPLFF